MEFRDTNVKMQSVRREANKHNAGIAALAMSIASGSIEDSQAGMPRQTSVTMKFAILEHVPKLRYATRNRLFFIPSCGTETSL